MHAFVHRFETYNILNDLVNFLNLLSPPSVRQGVKGLSELLLRHFSDILIFLDAFKSCLYFSAHYIAIHRYSNGAQNITMTNSGMRSSI